MMQSPGRTLRFLANVNSIKVARALNELVNVLVMSM
jgi:hypothetical protein